MGARITRRQLVLGAGTAWLGLLAGCGRLPGQAAPAAKLPRIGYLSTHSPLFAESFEAGLRELGYVSGENLAIEYRLLTSENELDVVAAGLVRLPVDILVTTSTPTTLAAKRATNSIPIVFLQTGDPVGTGLVASLARPGGNATGVTNIGTSLASKRLELLKETVPGLARVAVLARATNPNAVRELAETVSAAQVLGLQPQPLEVGESEELERAFEAAALVQAQAMTILGDALMTSHAARLAELALRLRLPAIYTGRPFVAAGGLLSYGPSATSQFHRAAYYVDRILRGAKPADLPVEQPMTFELVVNLKTARELGITFTPEILLQVTEVVE